jgi:acyl-CoA reductase-like NAD-dependent aldehyde dehydrogenase
MATTAQVPIGISDIWKLNTLPIAEAFLHNSPKDSRIVISNFISNSFSTETCSQYIDTFNPKTGNAYARIPISNASEVEAALTTAAEAFNTWRKTSRSVRSGYLQRIAELIRENKELLAVWESIDQGKTLERARVEVDRAISNFSYVMSDSSISFLNGHLIGTSQRTSCTKKLRREWSTVSP